MQTVGRLCVWGNKKSGLLSGETGLEKTMAATEQRTESGLANRLYHTYTPVTLSLTQCEFDRYWDEVVMYREKIDCGVQNRDKGWQYRTPSEETTEHRVQSELSLQISLVPHSNSYIATYLHQLIHVVDMNISKRTMWLNVMYASYKEDHNDPWSLWCHRQSLLRNTRSRPPVVSSECTAIHPSPSTLSHC